MRRHEFQCFQSYACSHGYLSEYQCVFCVQRGDSDQREVCKGQLVQKLHRWLLMEKDSTLSRGRWMEGRTEGHKWAIRENRGEDMDKYKVTDSKMTHKSRGQGLQAPYSAADIPKFFQGHSTSSGPHTGG